MWRAVRRVAFLSPAFLNHEVVPGARSIETIASTSSRHLREVFFAKISNDSGDPQDVEGSADLEKTLLNLPKLLKKRERELDKRELELKKMKTMLEQKHPRLGDPGDVLSLNVGGTKVQVLRRTLTAIEDSMLASQFSGRWDEGLAKDQEGSFFIDLPPTLFLSLIDYMSALAIETPRLPRAMPPSFAIRSSSVDFYRIIEYYGLIKALFPVGIHKCGQSENLVPVAGYPQLQVPTVEGETDKTTYCLFPVQSRNPAFRSRTSF